MAARAIIIANDSLLKVIDPLSNHSRFGFDWSVPESDWGNPLEAGSLEKSTPLREYFVGYSVIIPGRILLEAHVHEYGREVLLSRTSGRIAMHLPDGILDTKTALLATGAAAAGVGIALRQVRNTLEPRQMPMLGLAAAFVFAAQMINFPIPGATSGHVVGGVLTAVLLGPSAAVLVITCVLIVQCLMFSDGGLVALGANVFNMGIVSVCCGYFVFRLARLLIRSGGNRATVFAAAFAGWFGTVLASISCAGQLALSGAIPWSRAFPAMALVHMLIGIGEGLATGLIIMAVLRSRPDLVVGARREGVGSKAGFVGYGLVISAGLALFVAPFACKWPDGLEKVAAVFGISSSTAPAINAPLADYHLPHVSSPAVATALAGLIGTLLAFIAAYVLARVLVPVLGTAKKDASSGN
jgi:cobalt/nickel transport system permease protein